MEITVFGPGCAKCKELEALAKSVVTEMGRDIRVTKVSDLKEMMQAGVMSTPALAINGTLKSTGRIPSKDEIHSWIEGVK